MEAETGIQGSDVSVQEFRNIHFRSGEATADERGSTPMQTQTRNIHFSEPRTLNPDPSSSSPTFRHVNRSPNEEFALRVSKYGQPKHFSQSVIALILQKQKHVTVTKTGIGFEYQGNRYQFWSATSLVCANQVEKRVLVTFDPDDMSFCHVLTDDGRYVESVPQKNKVAWFDDDAMRQAMSDKAHALNRDLARYREIHQATSEQKAARVLSNAEKMQVVNTFPASESPRPQREPSESDDLPQGLRNPRRSLQRSRLSGTSRPASCSLPEGTASRSNGKTGAEQGQSSPSETFDKADTIADAVTELRRQRVSHQEREERIRTTEFSQDDMAAATGKEEEDPDYKISADEIAGVLATEE